MRYKKIVAIMLFVSLIAISICGCEKKDKYEKYYNNTVLVSKGEIVKIVEFHEISAYGSLETFEMIDDNKMIDFNYTVGGISVKREEAKAINSMTIRVVTEFNNFIAYSGYRGVKFMTGTVEASLVGFDYEDVKFLDTSGNSIETDKALANRSNYVVIIDEAMDIEIDGEIVYYSDNVNPTDSSHVTTTTDGISYIIFK